MRLRKSTDGSLFAPHRGKPPACPDGYERDPQDQYRFLPIVDPCEHRINLNEKSGCCGPISIMRCKAKGDKVILKSDCLACTNKAIKISVVIQNNPPSKFLEKLLQSLYRQMLDNMELIVEGGNVEELCAKYDAIYRETDGLLLATGQILVVTYSKVYQLFDCVETLVAPILEDKEVNTFGTVHFDRDGKFAECVMANDFDNIDIWKQCPETDYTLLLAKHRSSVKGNYVKTDAWAIDLGE